MNVLFHCFIVIKIKIPLRDKIFVLNFSEIKHFILKVRQSYHKAEVPYSYRNIPGIK